MPIRYFDFAGTPAKLILDDNELPITCEIYDDASDSFVERSALTPDLLHSYDARLIGEAEFAVLLEKVRRAGR